VLEVSTGLSLVYIAKHMVQRMGSVRRRLHRLRMKSTKKACHGLAAPFREPLVRGYQRTPQIVRKSLPERVRKGHSDARGASKKPVMQLIDKMSLLSP